MKTNWTFPRYLKTQAGLIAFMSKDKMFLIRNQGSNMNPGVCVDYFITRKMVLKHADTPGDLITREEFVRLYNQLFTATLNFMTP